MQTKTIIALLVAVVGINAAPVVEDAMSPRQATTVPIQIYNSAGCNNGPNPAFTANIAGDGACSQIGTTGITVPADSAFVATTLGPACQITLYYDSNCSSGNTLLITGAGQCRTFGTAGRQIRSARTNGPGNC
ncbi:hypothetical protein BDV96DRAFT_650190 [Lophiotrema nucula]|uniref:Uncharacterized protein n=1 Tax=Lophiotrema nucula TaxID=690887 RepID=A0A6A5YVJ1_9PLEO|nr:hypothetical protein BDV96DRAFT_650190 [Lophiotrema nucula]